MKLNAYKKPLRWYVAIANSVFSGLMQFNVIKFLFRTAGCIPFGKGGFIFITENKPTRIDMTRKKIKTMEELEELMTSLRGQKKSRAKKYQPNLSPDRINAETKKINDMVEDFGRNGADAKEVYTDMLNRKLEQVGFMITAITDNSMNRVIDMLNERVSEYDVEDAELIDLLRFMKKTQMLQEEALKSIQRYAQEAVDTLGKLHNQIEDLQDIPEASMKYLEFDVDMEAVLKEGMDELPDDVKETIQELFNRMGGDK